MRNFDLIIVEDRSGITEALLNLLDFFTVQQRR